ncbi:MAG: hypothetical protein WDW36_007114 [Sanguina aurantia]
MAGKASAMMKPENIDLIKKQAAGRSAGRSSTSATSNPSDAERLDGYTDEARDDFVTYLPGWGDVRDFNLFAGYITVDKASRRSLFYVMAQSKRSKADPLVLWLNGGPGCSSLGGGFMSELGPFYPTPASSTDAPPILSPNAYAWNDNAHMLFLESPAGVGFSYSEEESDYVVGDERTASDARLFMLRFYERFPQLTPNQLFLSGESYAGHYVPNLALAILRGNAQRDDFRIPLAGFLVGNPWTDAAIDNLGAVDFWQSHALLSDATALGIRSHCNFSYIGPLDRHCQPLYSDCKEDLCDAFCDRAVSELGPINIYHIYADVCLPPGLAAHATAATSTFLHTSPYPSLASLAPASDDSNTAAAAAAAAAATTSAAAAAPKVAQPLVGRATSPGGARALWGSGTEKPVGQGVQGEEGTHIAARRRAAEVSQQQQQQQQQQQGGGQKQEVPVYDPCVDDEVSAYLNHRSVQRALHANASGHLRYSWSDCTSRISYSREDLLSSMMPVYAELIRDGSLRMLVFSGDVDGIVPVVGTRRWVAALGLTEAQGWRPWYSGTGQVAGYAVDYQSSVTFATVRNAGHMVPYVQPERAYHLFNDFLAGRTL